MLRSRDINVGKCYVNNGSKVAREVIEVEQKIIRFNTYHLVSGNSCGSHSECTKRDFINWADREATPAEMDLLRSYKLEALLYAPRFPHKKESTQVAIKSMPELFTEELTLQSPPT